MGKVFLTTAQAAKYLGMSVSYLRKLMMAKEIPYFKPHGKLCYFDEQDLYNWVHNVRVASHYEVEYEAQKVIVNNVLNSGKRGGCR